MIINGKSATSDLFTDAVALGDGVFETLRTYNNQVFALERHLTRLNLGLSQIGVAGFDDSLVREAVPQILSSEPLESGALRISVYADGTSVLSHKPYKPAVEGLACFTTFGEGIDNSYKSTSYSDRLALRRLAVANGFDDAILVNREGVVSELSTSNLLIRIQDNWVTPELNSGCLPGVTRGFLIEEFGVKADRVTVEDFTRSTAVAAISSLREIQEIKAIDGKVFPSSRELLELQASFSAWILGNLLS